LPRKKTKRADSVSDKGLVSAYEEEDGLLKRSFLVIRKFLNWLLTGLDEAIATTENYTGDKTKPDTKPICRTGGV
jgi:hypothetical protein